MWGSGMYLFASSHLLSVGTRILSVASPPCLTKIRRKKKTYFVNDVSLVIKAIRQDIYLIKRFRFFLCVVAFTAFSTVQTKRDYLKKTKQKKKGLTNHLRCALVPVDFGSGLTHLKACHSGYAVHFNVSSCLNFYG